MIQIHINKACAHLCSPPELLTAGMAKAVTAEFIFSSDWDGLTKTAVFTNRKKTIDVLESEWDGNRLIVPHEILADAGLIARVGVYGSDASGVVLPTVWVSIGKVQPAAEPSGDPSTDQTLPVWQQLQNQIGNLDDLKTYAKDNLVAAINEARQSGGGSGGTTDHRDLINRDADDQHPIKAITGLQDKLNTIPPAAERITNSEIEEMLK